MLRQVRQTKPFGHRTVGTYTAQVSSSGKRIWNSSSEGGSRLSPALSEDVIFALTSTIRTAPRHQNLWPWTLWHKPFQQLFGRQDLVSSKFVVSITFEIPLHLAGMNFGLNCAIAARPFRRKMRPILLDLI